MATIRIPPVLRPSVGGEREVSAEGANVGFWAHIGGFVTGVGGVFVFRKRERQRVQWWS